MSGTVKQDAEVMSKALIDTMLNKLNNGDFIEGSDYKLADDNKSIRIDYQIYTGK